MVKLSDLGYASQNLEKIPNKDEKKKLNYEQALLNLTSTELPKSMRPVELPDSLFNLREE